MEPSKIVELAAQNGFDSLEDVVGFTLGYAQGVHENKASQQFTNTQDILKGVSIAIVGGGVVGLSIATSLTQNNTGAKIIVGGRDIDRTTGKVAAASDASGVKTFKVALVKDAVRVARVVVLATPGQHDDAGIQAIAASLGDTQGKIIIDATNPLSSFPDGLNVRWGGSGTSGGEVLAAALPSAKVYKAFNTIGNEHMRDASGALSDASHTDMLFAGPDDEQAKQTVINVICGVGFRAFHVGPIRYSRNLEAMAELWIHMAIPPLGARTIPHRKFAFALNGTNMDSVAELRKTPSQPVKIYYWAMHGRAGPAFRMLAEADIEFQHLKEFPEIAGQAALFGAPTDTLAPPIVIDGDKVVSQSIAVAAYIGEKYGFEVPDMIRGIQLANNAVDTFEGLSNNADDGVKFKAFLFGADGKPARFAVMLGALERSIKGPFVFGEKKSWVDFVIASLNAFAREQYLNTVERKTGIELFKDFPKLKVLTNSISGLASVSKISVPIATSQFKKDPDHQIFTALTDA